MTDMKMTDQVAGHEIAGQKIQCYRDYTLRYNEVWSFWCCYRHKHLNTLCVSYYLFRKSVTYYLF